MHKKIIRSSKVSLKFSNYKKIDSISSVLDEYKKTCQQFIDILWDMDKVPTLLPNFITDKVNTWLSARMIQSIGKQASGVVRGVKRKQNKIEWCINKLEKEGKFKRARKLRTKLNGMKLSKPSVKSLNMELDSRFINIDLDNETSFDGWITISSIGNKMKIQVPFKRTKHFNKLYKSGKILNGVRLNDKEITFNFEIEKKEPKTNGSTLGIDIGQSTLISASDSQTTDKDNHGHDYSTICERLARKKKGSKGFQRTNNHRKNHLNWAINRIDLSNVKEVRREEIHNLRYKIRSSRKLSHWNYADIVDKLDRRCEDLNVSVVLINPAYTSQRCSHCGWTRKRNRRGRAFVCSSCGYQDDADLNASKNISLDLIPISKKKRLSRPNIKGFFWNEVGQEHIVPVVQKLNME